jgi:hypothetical protein
MMKKKKASGLPELSAPERWQSFKKPEVDLGYLPWATGFL